jgi:preprotein translocase subunit YajC
VAEVLLITALVVGLFFFLFIRPTRREQSQRRRDLNALRIGDEVLTTGGLIGIVTAVETQPDGPMILSLELADGVVVRARTEAIAQILRPVDVIELDDEMADAADNRAARAGAGSRDDEGDDLSV